MNSRNGRGGAQPELGYATAGRVALATELEAALDKIRALGRSASIADSHEPRADDLKELISAAERALVASASLSSGLDRESGVVGKRGSGRPTPPSSSILPTEWLIRSVVHDLNNMLLVIQNCAESLRHHTSASVQREAHVVQDALTQATRLVGKLVPTEPRVGRPQGVDLSDCVERFSGVLGSLVGDPIEVVTRLGSDLPAVRCEETAIFRVLANLAANARDAMPAGGTLTVETSGVTALPGGDPSDATDSYVLLTVVDTGEGMDAETSERAFERFFTTKDPGKGTGVGLTAVREIVQNVGGSVHMESMPGRGTKVSVYLQCAELPA